MKVLVTGANGFIGKNLVFCLREQKDIEVLTFVRGQDSVILNNALKKADIVFHLAGENRPLNEEDFNEVNAKLTNHLCQKLCGLGKDIPVIFSSSIQAELDNPYGRSKLVAENFLTQLSKTNGNPVAIYRLVALVRLNAFLSSALGRFCF